MSEFSNVRVADEAARSQFINSSAAKALSGNSPFLEGAVFHLNGYDVCQSAWDGVVKANAPLKAVFKTQQGVDIPLTMLVSRKVAVLEGAKRGFVEAVGTFNAKVKALATAGNPSVDQLMHQAQAAAPNGLRVVRTPYTGVAKDGREYPASIVGFDIV